MLLLVFLTFIVCVVLSTDTPPLLPGAQLLNVGFDYRNGSQIDFEKIAEILPIFKYTFEKGHTYSPPTHPELVFSLPDDVYIMSTPMVHWNSYEGDFMSFSYVQKVSISSFHISGGFSYDGFGVNAGWTHEMGQVKIWAKLGINDIFLSNYNAVIYKAEVGSYLFMTMSDMWTEFMDHIPAQIKTEKDKEILTEFISKYGTHFTENGIFGGRWHYDSALKITFVNQTSEKWVSNQFSLSFYLASWNLTLGGGLFTNKSQIKIDQKYAKEADMHEFFEGGNLKYQTNASLGEWRDSLYTIQALVNGSLTPLWILVNDPTKAAVIKTAITNYIKHGKVDYAQIELDREILSSGFDATSGAILKSPIFEDVKVVRKPTGGEFDRTTRYDKVENVPTLWSSQRTKGVDAVHSSEVYSILKSLYGGSVVFDSKKTTSVLVAELDRSSSLSPVFVDAIKELPVNPDREEFVKYIEFVKDWGTSYVESVEMGGEMQMRVEMPVEAVENLGGSERVGKTVEDLFLHSIGVEGPIDITLAFLKNAKISSTNAPTHAKGDTWAQFKEGLRGSGLSPIGYTVKPITELVQCEKKSSLIRRAIRVIEVGAVETMDRWVQRMKE